MKGNCLRITGGIYKNRLIRIKKFKSSVRPTMARCRVCIFDILKPYMSENYKFFDGFCGYGSMGIEALSRKAGMVVFCDLEKDHIVNIKRNVIELTKASQNHHLMARSMMKLPAGNPMNIIFLDPPYECAYILPDVIHKMYLRNWIDNNTIIVCETSNKSIIKFRDNVSIIRTKHMGDSCFTFCKIDTLIESSIINDI